MGKEKDIAGWGNFPIHHNAEEITDPVGKPNVTIRGAGRSYGDAALGDVFYSPVLEEELVIEDGVLLCSASTTLGSALEFTLPKGYLIPVIPGTQHVTIGGMLAMDVHGKNHFSSGTIGEWVEFLHVQLYDGSILKCSLTENSDLFKSTLGGLGLTGIIRSAGIRLLEWKGGLTQKSSIYSSVRELCNELLRSDAEYQVAWINGFDRSQNILFEGESILSKDGRSSFIANKQILTVPKLPFRILSDLGMKWYNRRYFRKNRNRSGAIDIDSFFFPLDNINNWNRVYGPKGMVQYQFIVPMSEAIDAIETILNRIEWSKHSPWLIVLKKYRENGSPAMLSFPIEGLSLAIDFPMKSGLVEFLRELDGEMLKYGGRTYLAKDAILTSEVFSKMYPESKEFKQVMRKYNNGSWSSDMSTRLNLK